MGYKKRVPPKTVEFDSIFKLDGVVFIIPREDHRPFYDNAPTVPEVGEIYMVCKENAVASGSMATNQATVTLTSATWGTVTATAVVRGEPRDPLEETKKIKKEKPTPAYFGTAKRRKSW